MATNELLTLVDEAVAKLEDARVLAIEADDAPTRTLLAGVIFRIETYRSDLEKKYGLPDEAGCVVCDTPTFCIGCPHTTRLEG